MKCIAMISIILVLAACEKKTKSQETHILQPSTVSNATASSSDSGAITQASRDIFGQRCATCHGPLGKGDGPAGAALHPKPRDFTDTVWQRSVSDDYLRKIIIEGGSAVGKSPMMVANTDLRNKLEVVDGIIKLIRQSARHQEK